VAGSPTVQWGVPTRTLPEDAKDAERRVYEQQAADKPEDIRPKIAEASAGSGSTTSYCCARSTSTPDKHEEKTIQELRDELSAKTGENVVIRRFRPLHGGE